MQDAVALTLHLSKQNAEKALKLCPNTATSCESFGSQAQRIPSVPSDPSVPGVRVPLRNSVDILATVGRAY